MISESIPTVCYATAKKLKRAGFPQNTRFYWRENATGVPELVMGDNDSPEKKAGLLAAPLASEITDNYPFRVWITVENGLKHREGIFYFVKKDKFYVITLMIKGSDNDLLYEIHSTRDTSEAEARSLMYLFLREQAMLD